MGLISAIFFIVAAVPMTYITGKRAQTIYAAVMTPII